MIAEIGAGRLRLVGADDVARRLLDVLNDLQQVLHDLLELSRNKLTALREADADALQRAAELEALCIERLVGVHDRRRAVLAELAQTLHWPGARSATLTQISGRLEEPLASALRARSEGLRAMALDMEKNNRLAAAVARGLHEHLRGVFADLARACETQQVYDSRGQAEAVRDRLWVDAIG
jgi:hypothetical protein